MNRKVVIDTETTGFKPEEGHRIVEIGAVEIIKDENGKYVKTGNVYQVYINPETEIDPDAERVHGLSYEFLKDKPVIAEVIDGFLEFIRGAEVIIHNAPFDRKFLDHELMTLNKGQLKDYIALETCSLKLSRTLYAKEKSHKLDALCEMFEIDNSNRTFHGALLDAELLTECYIAMDERNNLDELDLDFEQINWTRPEIKRYNVNLSPILNSVEDEAIHNAVIDNMSKTEKVQPIYLQENQTSNKLKP